MKEELLLDLSDCNHPPIFLKINGQEFFPTKKKKKKQRGRELPVTRGLLIAVINSQHPAGEKTQRSAGSGGVGAGSDGKCWGAFVPARPHYAIGKCKIQRLGKCLIKGFPARSGAGIMKNAGEPLAHGVGVAGAALWHRG